MFVRKLPDPNHPDAGLSLIELLIVAVIVGILAAVTGIATWGSFLKHQRLNAANDTIYRAMREAQQNAKTSNLAWQVSFREQGDRVQFAIHRGDSAEFVPTAVLNNRAYWRELPPGVFIDRDRNDKGKYETSLRKASDTGPWRVLFNYQGCLVYKPDDSCGKTSLRALGRVTFGVDGTGKLRRCVIVSTLIGTLREGENHAKADSTGKYCYFKAKSSNMPQQQPGVQFLTVEESADVDRALLSSSEKFLTRLTISSLRLLKMIAEDCDVAIADLTHEQIVSWFEKDGKIRREQGIDAAVLKWEG